MDRRHFALVTVPAALLTGCRSSSKPARDATLFHNKAVSTAMVNLQEAVHLVEERMTGFGPENWRDALASLQTATIRLRSDMDELRGALGYASSVENELNDHS